MGTSPRARPSSRTSAHRTERLFARVRGHSTRGPLTRRTTRWFSTQTVTTELTPSRVRAHTRRVANDDGCTDIASVLVEIGDAELREVLVGWNALRSEHPDRVASNAFRLRENVHQLGLTIEALLNVADDEGQR